MHLTYNGPLILIIHHSETKAAIQYLALRVPNWKIFICPNGDKNGAAKIVLTCDLNIQERKNNAIKKCVISSLWFSNENLSVSCILFNHWKWCALYLWSLNGKSCHCNCSFLLPINQCRRGGEKEGHLTALHQNANHKLAPTENISHETVFSGTQS